MSTELIDVEMPDGTVISGVPKGTSQEEVQKRYNASKATPAVAPSGKTSFTDEDYHQMKKDAFREISSLAVGGLAQVATKNPTLANLSMAAVDYAVRKMNGDQNQVAVPILGDIPLPNTGSKIVDAVIDIGGNMAVNATVNRVLQTAFKIPRGINNLRKTSSTALSTLKLKPSYGQLNPDSLMNDVEDVLLPKAKSESVVRSNRLSKDAAQDLAGDLSGTKITSMVGRPVATRQAIATAIEDQTQQAFKGFIRESNLQAENVKNIAARNVTAIPIVTPGQPTGLVTAQGQPIIGQPTVTFQNIEGAITPQKLVNRVLALKDEVEHIATKPEPNSPLMRDLNSILDVYTDRDPATGKITGYKPINFKDAWAQKIDLADKGWGNSNRSDISVVDSRYKALFKAMSEDIQDGIGTWKVQGAEAAKSYGLARTLVSARNKLFEGANPTRLINLADVKEPSPAINSIVDDDKELKKFLIMNEYKLPNGQNIVGGNKRGLLKAYQFSRMWEDANAMNTAGDITNSHVSVKSFIDDWNKFKTSKNGSTLYSQADMGRIDEFAKAIQTSLSEGSSGVSKYVNIRLATGGFHLAAGMLGAAFISGNGLNMTSGMLGTAALTTVVLTARQVGKMLLNNPDAAAILNQAALGKPLGRSLQGASQVLAYALRNETINLALENGMQVPVKLDAQGKAASQAMNADGDQFKVKTK